MNRVFRIIEPFCAPDGTLVSPFLNPLDCKSGLPIDLLTGFSLSAGIIGPKTRSKIHIMPFVTQVTFARRGVLEIRMKASRDEEPYLLSIETNQAALIEPDTFLQLINEGDEPCEVLYIVSPAYMFEMTDGQVVYDDSVVLEEDWEELKSNGWHSRAQMWTRAQRQETERRLVERGN